MRISNIISVTKPKTPKHQNINNDVVGGQITSWASNSRRYTGKIRHYEFAKIGKTNFLVWDFW